MKPVRIGSLFSGIGGFELGFEMAGWQTDVRWQIEIDPYCRKVLAKHWPKVKRYADITTITGRAYRRMHKLGLLSDVDLICGGFPCQDLSYAGKGAGLAGERSGLWWDMLRIIRLARPRIVLVENVPALLGRGMGIVVQGLAQSGYDCEWDCIPALAVGAPHRRDRLWVVGYADGGAGWRNTRAVPRTQTSESCAGQSDRCEPDRSGNASPGSRARVLADAGCEPLEGGQAPGATDRPELRRYAQWWAVEPDVGRVAHGVPHRVDRLKGLGNAVVPQVVARIAKKIDLSHI